MNEKFLELPEEKRLKIINAGFEIFSKSDYKHASTEDIAAKAGISKGLLFYYFHNKQALYLFLLEYAKDLLMESVVDFHFTEITDVFDLLEYASVRKYRLLQKSPHIMDFLMRIVFMQQESVSDGVNQIWQNTSNDIFTNYFAKMDYSKFREDVNPTDIVQMLIWTAEGYMSDRHRAGTEPYLDDLMDKFKVWTDMYKRIAYKEEYLK